MGGLVTAVGFLSKEFNLQGGFYDAVCYMKCFIVVVLCVVVLGFFGAAAVVLQFFGLDARWAIVMLPVAGVAYKVLDAAAISRQKRNQ